MSSGEHVQNGDHSDAHLNTFSQSSKEVSVAVVHHGFSVGTGMSFAFKKEKERQCEL